MHAPILAVLALLGLQQGDKKGEVQPPLPPGIKIPPAPVVPPEKALETFKVAPGFRLELFASEPLVSDPVAISFDADGRMWVVEMRGYMPDVDGRGEADPVGRISCIEDTDGDGKADRSTVFLDKLILPRAIAAVWGGLLVAEPPNLWFCRDTDGDGKCDEKTLVEGKYGGRGNPEHTANGLLPAIDNWIYSADTGMRFRRIDGKWVRSDTRSRGQWGLTQDDIGRLFFNHNSVLLRGDHIPCYSPLAFSKRAGDTNVDLTRSQAVWPIRPNTGVNRGYRGGTLRPDGTLSSCTAACAPVIYRGDALPADCRGNAFVCEPAGNLVTRILLTEEGGKVVATPAYAKSEFLASTDERFRPVNLATGPDGALYIVDLYRGILQHKNFVTTFLRQQILDRGLDKHIGLGRIYRVTSEGKATPKPPALTKETSAALVKRLSHPNGWVRDAAQRLLVERKDLPVAGELRMLVSAKDPIPALHALWTLEGLRQVDAALLAAAEKAPRLGAAVAALKEASGPLSPLDQLAISATTDPNVPDALLAGKELDLLERLMANEAWEEPNPGREALLSRIAARVSAQAKPESLAELLDLTASQSTSALWRQRALIEGFAIKEPVVLAERSAALVKLTFSPDEAVRARAREAGRRVSWAGKPEREPEPPRAPPLDAAEKARWERGKKQFAFSCAVCHQLSGLGEVGKAPPLVDSEWVLGSEQRLARIIVNGLTGPLKVGERTYSNIEMPAVLNMSSDEIAEALTYIRREWGHQAAPVSPETVKKIRAALEDREDPWTDAELRKIP